MNQVELITRLGLAAGIIGAVLIAVIMRKEVKLLGLALLYLGGSSLLLNVCSFQICAALFVCGIGVVVLFWSAVRETSEFILSIKNNIIQIIFRFTITFVLGLLTYTSMKLLRFWIPVSQPVLFLCLFVSLVSLVSLALNDTLLYRCIYLQSLCLSFTICYVFIENSTLVFASFSAINLLMSFCGSVLVMGAHSNTDSETTDQL